MQFSYLGTVATVILTLTNPQPSEEVTVAPPAEPVAVVKEQGLLRADVLELQAQMKVSGTMPPSYWRDVAQCETQQNWQDKGKWGGGVGMATTTWRNYGGYEFAKHPSEATPYEQMVVANRVAVLGYQTKNTFLTLDDKLNNRPYFRPRAGFFGWGCIANNRYLHPKRWRDNNRREWRRGKKNVLFPHG